MTVLTSSPNISFKHSGYFTTVAILSDFRYVQSTFIPSYISPSTLETAAPRATGGNSIWKDSVVFSSCCACLISSNHDYQHIREIIPGPSRGCGGCGGGLQTLPSSHYSLFGRWAWVRTYDGWGPHRWIQIEWIETVIGVVRQAISIYSIGLNCECTHGSRVQSRSHCFFSFHVIYMYDTR